MGYSDLPGPNNGYSDAVDIYNVSSKAWSDTRLPSSTEYHRKDGKRMYGTAVGCGGSIIFAGGQIGGGRSAAVDVLDAATGQWAPSIGNLTVARSALAAACAGDRFALFGGGSDPFEGYCGRARHRDDEMAPRRDDQTQYPSERLGGGRGWGLCGVCGGVEGPGRGLRHRRLLL